MEENADGKFFIRSGDEGFKNRQTGVFDQLSMLEDKHSAAVSTWKNDPNLKFEEEVDEVVENSTIVTSKAANAELFKVPIGLPPKRIARPTVDTNPDYNVHPEKWTKYTLSDVTQESLSEDANSEAAMDFLKSRWKAGNDYQEPNEEGADDEPSKSTPALEFGKFLMPEYSIGSKPSNKAKRMRRNEDEKPEANPPKVKLSFLNSICPNKTEDPEPDGGEGVENRAPQADGEEKDLPRLTLDSKPASPGANDVFRTIRKRRRNFRQATVSFDEMDGDN